MLGRLSRTRIGTLWSMYHSKRLRSSSPQDLLGIARPVLAAVGAHGSDPGLLDGEVDRMIRVFQVDRLDGRQHEVARSRAG